MEENSGIIFGCLFHRKSRNCQFYIINHSWQKCYLLSCLSWRKAKQMYPLICLRSRNL